jgi:hypothetical protein
MYVCMCIHILNNIYLRTIKENSWNSLEMNWNSQWMIGIKLIKNHFMITIEGAEGLMRDVDPETANMYIDTKYMLVKSISS